MARKKFTLDFHELYQRHLRGESVKQIAVSTRLTHDQLRRAFYKRGLVLRTGRDYPALHTRYIAGETISDLARETGIMASSMRRRFRELGWPVLSLSDTQKRIASRRSRQERLRNTAAAHAAMRGSKRGHAELVRRAKTHEKFPEALITEGERELSRLLQAVGLHEITFQKSIDKYNVDIALPPIAVEIYGGAWHGTGRHAARFQERTKKILDSGWHLVIIWVEKPHYPLTLEAARYLVTLSQFASRNPAAPCQYRVIRGTGEVVIRGCVQDDHFPMKLPRISRQKIGCDHLRVADNALRML